MSFRTQYIQIDGSLNVDGSVFLYQVPISVGTIDLSSLDIASYVNTSTYYDASIQNRYLPNPSTLIGDLDSQGIYVKLIAGETVYAHNCVYLDSGGKVRPASLDSSSKMPVIALYMPLPDASSYLVAGQEADFLIFGPYKNISAANYTPGKQILIDQWGVPSNIEPSIAGQCKQVVGIFTSIKSGLFNPSPDFIILK